MRLYWQKNVKTNGMDCLIWWIKNQYNSTITVDNVDFLNFLVAYTCLRTNIQKGVSSEKWGLLHSMIASLMNPTDKLKRTNKKPNTYHLHHTYMYKSYLPYKIPKVNMDHKNHTQSHQHNIQILVYTYVNINSDKNYDKHFLYHRAILIMLTSSMTESDLKINQESL